MKPTAVFLLAAMAAVGALAGGVAMHVAGGRPTPDAVVRATTPQRVAGADGSHRAFELAALAPTLPPDAIDDAIHRSDTWVARLQAEGIDDVGSEISRRLAAATPTDEQAWAFYDAHRDLFGDRSFAASRNAVDRLCRIRAVRASLEAAGDEP